MSIIHLLPARLKAARNAAGMTRAQVAEKVGKGPNTLQNIESGLNAPSVALLEKLANVYGIPLASLFEESTS